MSAAVPTIFAAQQPGAWNRVAVASLGCARMLASTWPQRARRQPHSSKEHATSAHGRWHGGRAEKQGGDSERRWGWRRWHGEPRRDSPPQHSCIAPVAAERHLAQLLRGRGAPTPCGAGRATALRWRARVGRVLVGLQSRSPDRGCGAAPLLGAASQRSHLLGSVGRTPRRPCEAAGGGGGGGGGAVGSSQKMLPELMRAARGPAAGGAGGGLMSGLAVMKAAAVVAAAAVSGAPNAFLPLC